MARRAARQRRLSLVFEEFVVQLAAPGESEDDTSERQWPSRTRAKAAPRSFPRKGLALADLRWDTTIVKLIADENGRLACKELFTPRKPFSAERQPDGSIRVIELVEKDVPVVRPVRTRQGFLMLPRKLGRKTVMAAIRADRDAQ